MEILKTRLLKKLALGNFKNSQFEFIEEIINFLNQNSRLLADMAGRSSNFDVPYDLIYNQVIPQLQSALRMEKEDNEEELQLQKQKNTSANTVSRLKKHALGGFTTSQLDTVDKIITFLLRKENKLGRMCNASSNFEEAYDLIYDQIVPQLQSGVKIEREDNGADTKKLLKDLFK